MGIIIGAVLIVIGAIISTVVRKKIINKNIEIQYMKTTPIPELKHNLQENAAQGLTGYREYVEVKGIAVADNPHKTPYSETSVVYYDAQLYQVYEEMQTYEDSDGKRQQRMVRTESQMSTQKSPGPIIIKDATGEDRAYVDLLEFGMQLDTVKSLDKFEPSNNMKQYGFFSQFTFGNMGARTLGFRMVENIIPINHPLYALGEAYLENDQLKITKPADPKRPFILSTRSEEDLIHSNKSSANMSLYGGIALAVVGVILMFII
jgi:hypothetical protein